MGIESFVRQIYITNPGLFDRDYTLICTFSISKACYGNVLVKYVYNLVVFTCISVQNSVAKLATIS